jgi:glycosyltransferase involved in cell wall biosynthesis
MPNEMRLIWLCPEFVPTHEVVWDAIAQDSTLRLHVYAMMPPTTTHPWILQRERPYKWGISRVNRGIDFALIRQVLADKDAWVIVASYLKPTLLAAMYLLALKRRNFIYYTDTPLLQDVEWNSGRARKRSPARRVIRSMLLKWIFQNAYRVLATGTPGVRNIVALGCPKEKVVNFPCWTKLDTLTRTYNRSSAGITLIGVGQLCYRKGYDVAIRALARAEVSPTRRPRLLLIGDGAARSELSRMASEYGVSDRVQVTRWVQPPEVAQALSEADVFVHPARWDPFPVAVLEAMAAGLPVLGSDQSGSVADRIEHGVSGFIHQVDNVDELAIHISDMCAEPQRIQQMGSAARMKAEEWPAGRGVRILKEILAGG